MKRMNLLPPEVRPREGGRRGSAHILVGALAAAVVAMISYAVVMGGVRADENELAALKDETQQAQARADALSPYGEFADMKDRREQSVRLVADSRFDYERLTRELAQILPDGVWVGHLDVSPSPPPDEALAAQPDAAGSAQPAPGPEMKLSGCAPDQEAVADTLDRLRALNGATDVSLGSSSRSEAARSAVRSPHLVSGSGASKDCGRAERPRVSFDATVTLEAPQPQDAEAIPAVSGS